jgi:DNA-binding LacI/PurR family transcriptional regulator
MKPTISEHLRVDRDSANPLAAQLATQLAWLIARGELQEGDRLPPIRGLADSLEINFNTVRAAYKRLEAEGLVVPKQGVGTTVRRYRRQHRRNDHGQVRTFAIGVIIPAHLEFYAPFLNALESASTDPSLLFICVAQQDPLRGLSYLDQLVAKNVDGIVVAGAMVPPAIDMSSLPPIVFADFPGAPGPSVLFDHERASDLAVTHLIEHGHRRIGFIAPSRELPPANPKHVGYERALTRAGLEYREELVEITPDFAVESGEDVAMRLLARVDRPSAIAAASDSLAVGAMRGAKQLGIRVPDDLALVGNDNIASSADTAPPLTTVVAPADELGVRTIEMLEGLIAGRPLDRSTVMLETQLVLRRSCGC